jgi:hypothetical protein
MKEKGKITNKEYQDINNTSDRSATRDLENLISKGILKELETKKVLIMKFNLADMADQWRISQRIRWGAGAYYTLN